MCAAAAAGTRWLDAKSAGAARESPGSVVHIQAEAAPSTVTRPSSTLGEAAR